MVVSHLATAPSKLVSGTSWRSRALYRGDRFVDRFVERFVGAVVRLVLVADAGKAIFPANFLAMKRPNYDRHTIHNLNDENVQILELRFLYSAPVTGDHALFQWRGSGHV